MKSPIYLGGERGFCYVSSVLFGRLDPREKELTPMQPTTIKGIHSRLKIFAPVLRVGTQRAVQISLGGSESLQGVAAL